MAFMTTRAKLIRNYVIIRINDCTASDRLTTGYENGLHSGFDIALPAYSNSRTYAVYVLRIY